MEGRGREELGGGGREAKLTIVDFALCGVVGSSKQNFRFFADGVRI